MQFVKNIGGVFVGALLAGLATVVVVPIVSFILGMLLQLAMWEWLWWDVVWKAILFTVRMMLAIVWFIYLVIVGVVAINHEMKAFGDLWDSVWKWNAKW